MRENEIRKAFDEIEPEEGARERMYANILKKAAAQGERKEEQKEARQGAWEPVTELKPAPQKHRPAAWRRWGGLAACLALVLALSAVLPRVVNGGQPSDPPVLGGSPFEDVTGPEDFEKLGFTIDAPAGAENRYYCIYDGKIARVDFTLDGHEYTYEAAKLEGNFSRAEGEAVGSVSLGAALGATLDRVSPDTWRAHWSRDGVSYYLTNFDGAGEEDISAVANALMGEN